MTLDGRTVYPYGSIDTNFDLTQFSLDSIFKIHRLFFTFASKESCPSEGGARSLKFPAKTSVHLQFLPNFTPQVTIELI
jgi:hypothetical protein